jgi:catechol-2,3-dioxygenase
MDNPLSITPVLVVQDLVISRTFYVKLGLQIRSGSASHSCLSLTSSKTSPEILLQEMADAAAKTTNLTLRIKIDNELSMEQLRQSLLELSPSEITARGWGEQHFSVEDPDGNLVEISQAKPIYQG